MAEVNDLEKAFEQNYLQFERGIRQHQRSEFACCIKCTDDPNSSADEYNQCLQRCKAPLTAVSEAVQQEITRFQERYMRCARDCEDKVRDRITPDMKSLPKELEDELTSCATQCSKQYTSLVPQLFKKLDDYVKEATKHEL
eukprot:gene10837-2913_t